MIMQLTMGEIIQVVTTVVGVVAVITALRNDMKWVREMLKDHEAEDIRRFEELREDVRSATRRHYNEG